MNSPLLVSTDASVLPERVVTDWRRFSSGLWRLPEGDIQAAYCADTFPKVKTCMHAGRLRVRWAETRHRGRERRNHHHPRVRPTHHERSPSQKCPLVSAPMQADKACQEKLPEHKSRKPRDSRIAASPLPVSVSKHPRQTGSPCGRRVCGGRQHARSISGRAYSSCRPTRRAELCCGESRAFARRLDC